MLDRLADPLSGQSVHGPGLAMGAPGRGRQLCVEKTRSPGLAPSVGLPDGVEELHPKVTATALIGDEQLQLIGL